MKERTKLLLIILVFLACCYVPWSHPNIRQAGLEAFMMLQEYAREHVLTCLIPAFFIAGAIAVFVSQASVLKYFGASAKKILSYSVASISGSVLAVCSCTVLPLFAGIYTRGAGIGPATAFLYSGPAINVLAIVLTARILGWQMGLARAIGAIFFAIITGLLMAFFFRKDDAARETGQIYVPMVMAQKTLVKALRAVPIQMAIYFSLIVPVVVSVLASFIFNRFIFENTGNEKLERQKHDVFSPNGIGTIIIEVAISVFLIINIFTIGPFGIVFLSGILTGIAFIMFDWNSNIINLMKYLPFIVFLTSAFVIFVSY